MKKIKGEPLKLTLEESRKRGEKFAKELKDWLQGKRDKIVLDETPIDLSREKDEGGKKTAN